MARHVKAQRQKPEPPKYRCRDCAHSYDWQNRSHEGDLILCRCPYDEMSQCGKFCKFLSDYQCHDHFKKRTAKSDAQTH